MFHRRDTAHELRNEVSQLRGDVNNLAGAMRDTARSTFTAASGQAEDLYDAALEHGRRTARVAGKAVSDHPFLTAGVALGLGLLIGTLLLRRR